MIAVDLALGVSLYSGLRKGLDMPHQLAAGITAEQVRIDAAAVKDHIVAAFKRGKRKSKSSPIAERKADAVRLGRLERRGAIHINAGELRQKKFQLVEILFIFFVTEEAVIPILKTLNTGLIENGFIYLQISPKRGGNR